MSYACVFQSSVNLPPPVFHLVATTLCIVPVALSVTILMYHMCALLLCMVTLKILKV